MLNGYNIVVCPARCHLALLFLGCDIPITNDGLYHLFSEFSFAAIAQLLEFSGLHCCLFVKVQAKRCFVQEHFGEACLRKMFLVQKTIVRQHTANKFYLRAGFAFCRI